MTITTTPVKESILFGDDPGMIVEMLRDQWSLGPEDTPTITHIPEEYMTSARVALIYVYQVSRYNSVSSTDYNTIQRTSFLAIRTSTRFRPKFFQYMEEIYRIIYANRRVGQGHLGGYTFMEVINDRTAQDVLGWYTNTMDIKLTAYVYPLKSAGFGDKINRKLADKTNIGDAQ